MNVLRKAIEAGDATTATAVLGAPSYLSGLDPDLHAEYLIDWHNAQRPVEAKKIRAMKAAADILNNRFKLLTKAVGLHEEYHEDWQGRRVLARTWTAGEIRARVKASNERFAVPV